LFVETAAKTLAASGTLRTAAGTVPNPDNGGPFPVVCANTDEDWFDATKVTVLLHDGAALHTGGVLIIVWEDPWNSLAEVKDPWWWLLEFCVVCRWKLEFEGPCITAAAGSNDPCC
jgi:hypothetical protein